MNVESMVDFLNGIIWSNALIYFCLGAGIFFSVLLKFPQVRLIKDMAGQMLSGESSENGVSSFQGFAIALGGRVGTGNIAGIATLRDYEAQKKQGLDPIFVPENLAIKNADIWKTIGARYKKKIS